VKYFIYQLRAVFTAPSTLTFKEALMAAKKKAAKKKAKKSSKKK